MWKSINSLLRKVSFCLPSPKPIRVSCYITRPTPVAYLRWYLYSAGCTTQACGFRDNLPEFENLDYAVFCLSADSPAAQAKWAAKVLADSSRIWTYDITKQIFIPQQKQFGFSLLSDPERTLIRALGTLKSPTSTKRSHFVFEKGTAKLIEKKLGVKPADRFVGSLFSDSLSLNSFPSSPTDVLKFLKSHHA
jgi:peroxiredoxin